MKNQDGLLQCSRLCIKKDICCENDECKLWINYKDEHNCTLISIYENGCMTLRQAAERLGISFARVKQIETQALEKIRKRCRNNSITF